MISVAKLIQKVSCNGMREMTTERIEEVCIEHTRLHLEALAEELFNYGYFKRSKKNSILSGYLAKNKIGKAKN